MTLEYVKGYLSIQFKNLMFSSYVYEYLVMSFFSTELVTALASTLFAISDLGRYMS